jgi:hypothetical protein
MKIIGLLLVALLEVSVCLAASPQVTVVYPTGKYPDDVNNVQTAVSAGGAVLLKSVNRHGLPTAFNFLLRSSTQAGPNPSGVDLEVDVRVLGESGAGRMTTILGGYQPFAGGSPVRRDIEGIDFKSPLSAAMRFLGSTGLTIIGNRIEDTIPEVFPNPAIPTQSDGIDVYNSFTGLTSISGSILIAENFIRVTDGQNLNGIQFDTVAADIQVRDNTIEIAGADTGCESFCLGISAVHLGGKAQFSRNFVTLAHGSAEASGIGLFYVPFRSARVLVTDNIVGSECPDSDGIDLIASYSAGEAIIGAIVTNNIIWLEHSQSGAMNLDGIVSNSVVNNNALYGNAMDGISISYDTDPATELQTNNSVNGNNLHGFTSGMADIFLDTTSSNTQGTDVCQRVVDAGTNNHVMCRREQ